MISDNTKKKIRRAVKRRVIRLARDNAAFETFYLNNITKKREKIFSLYADLPVDDRLIVFESYMGRQYSDSPKAVYEYMLSDSRFDEFHFIWCLRGPARWNSNIPMEDPRTHIVGWGTDEYYEAYARAGIWIPNTRLPEVIKRKDEQVYIQCMHGTPFKRTGIDNISMTGRRQETTRRVVRGDAGRYSYLLSQSPYFSRVISSAFELDAMGMEDVLVETGLPRNDRLLNHSEEDVARVRRFLGVSDDKRLILYAPTFRDDNRVYGYKYTEPLDLQAFLEHIPQDIVILFRTHYFITDRFDFEHYGGRIIDVSDYPDINDLYIASSALITDYSSSMFDYSILQRPVINYMYDLEHYRDRLRGFYIDVDDLGGVIARTQDELEKAIANMDEWANTDENRKRMRAFRERFATFDDGKATERVANIVIDNSR